MNLENLPSRLLENAVSEFSKLPGIGKKTALRLILYMLKQDKQDVLDLTYALTQMIDGIKYCTVCNNISDEEVCLICRTKSRDHTVVCVVETIRDVLAIENTHQYNGLYHVLGGVISPMDGIGPDDLSIAQLKQRASNGNINEIIFALSATMEGDTTNFFLYKKLSQYNIQFSTLARGVAFGDELEYTDQVTLGRSIANRIKFETE